MNYDIYNIEMTETSQTIGEMSEKRKVSTIDWDTFDKITNLDTQEFFRCFGGEEIAEKRMTCAGLQVVKLTSINPTNTFRKVRTFNFKIK